MDKTGQIEIRIVGRQGNLALSPDSYDVRQVQEVLRHAEGLLFGAAKRDRPLVTYRLEEGSVRHVLTTALQTVIGFQAILLAVQLQGELDFLQPDTARALEYFQAEARQHDYRFELKTSMSDAVALTIDATTHFTRTAASWVAAELYFYGRITDIGGTTRPNLHLQTADAGTVVLQTTREELQRIEANPLYQEYGVRATGEQDPRTGEVNRQNLQFVELIDYQSTYDASYLAALRRRAVRTDWPADADAWLRDLRGYAD